MRDEQRNREEQSERQEGHEGRDAHERRDADEPQDAAERRSRREAAALGVAAAAAGLAAAAAGTNEPADSQRAELASAVDVTGERARESERAWDLPVTRNDRVDFFIDFLMGKNYDKTHAWLERIGRYGPLIQEELRRAGLPQDLLYLAMIESGLDPNAYSAAHAAGIWQFIEETGERYGLEVSSYVDERRDPVRATRAAIAYLKDLNQRFDGSWYLAMAGYNTGENRVERILNEQAGGQKGDENLFWQIMDFLPRETRDYVPVTLAMGHIAKDPGAYGFTDVRALEPLRFDEVVVPGGTGLAEIAEIAGVDPDLIEELNPHLVRGVTPPDRNYPVRVPAGSGAHVAAQFDTQPVVSGPRLAD